MLRVKTQVGLPPSGSLVRAIGPSLCVCVGLSLCLGPSSAQAQELPVELPERVPAAFMTYLGADWLERPERVAEEMPAEMLAVMGLEDGDVVADLGAGSGYYTRRMARLVAPSGTVFAVDIQPEMLELLRIRAEEEGVTGIQLVLSEPDDPKLPEGVVDWILIVDVYHELSDPEPVLARLRASLKPDGRVALVEYRVEDGSGDHIKADHRMSVRQVLSEWKPAGFELVELHEFLPSQHVFIFQANRQSVTAGIEPRPVIADYDILEAIREGHVELVSSEGGAESVSLTLRRTRPEAMVITFPVGTYFEAEGEASDLIARRDGALVLTDDDPHEWGVPTRPVHRTRPIPQPQDRFEIRHADEHTGPRNVMWLFQGMILHPRIGPFVEQLALWIASEDAGYDDLVEYAGTGALPSEDAVALAIVYMDRAGIDVTRKRIWRERERFVPALNDAGLKQFFETRGRN